MDACSCDSWNSVYLYLNPDIFPFFSLVFYFNQLEKIVLAEQEPENVNQIVTSEI